MNVRLVWCGDVFRHLFISVCVFLLLPSLLQGAWCLPQDRCPSWPWEQQQLDFSLHEEEPV